MEFNSDEEVRFNMWKTGIYTVIDFLVVSIALFTFFKYRGTLKTCSASKFNLWLVAAILLNLISFFVNFHQLRQVKSKYITVGTVAFGFFVDLFLLVLSVSSPYMLNTAQECGRNHLPWLNYCVMILASVMFIRVLHLVLMILFLIFCVPCYCCGDNCFIKKRLLNKKGVSQAVYRHLSDHKWVFKVSNERSLYKVVEKELKESLQM